MSLASRMSSLFTTGTTTTGDNSSQSSSTSTSTSNSSTAAASGSIHDDHLQGGEEFEVSRKSKRARIMEDGEGEELEGRPPYLHVCFLLIIEGFLSPEFPGLWWKSW